MKRKLRVLHIASFLGNIGDNANHKGAKYLRDRYLNYDFCITKKEIRSFYWGEWKYNSQEFVAEANQYDLIVVGGGNYLELWVKNSETGTSIDLGVNYLRRIKTPVLFYSLGCDLGQGVPEENIAKFRDFLDYLTTEKRYFVSVRNDGALDNIRSLYGSRYSEHISEIPDGGFFTQVDDLEHAEIEYNKINLVINIAGDMLDVRFPTQPGFITYDTFVTDFVKFIEDINQEYQGNLNIIFVPHIFRDLKPIYDILATVSDKTRRANIKVAPYLTGDRGHDYVFSLYNQCDLVLGMRFHANVCSYALHKNVIGLVNYVQIQNLYSNIDSSQFVQVNREGFYSQLKAKVQDHLSNRDKYCEDAKEIRAQLAAKAECEFAKLNTWLTTVCGGTTNE